MELERDFSSDRLDAGAGRFLEDDLSEEDGIMDAVATEMAESFGLAAMDEGNTLAATVNQLTEICVSMFHSGRFVYPDSLGREEYGVRSASRPL